MITSVNNERIKEICKLKEKKYRDNLNLFIVEGEHLVNEAYKYNLLKEIYILDNTNYDFSVPTTIVSREVMKKISSLDSIPSIIGIAYKKKEDVIGDKLLILDDIQDPGNVGTIIRSASAFDIDSIILSANTVDLYNSKVIRSTQGMIFNTNIITRDLASFIKKLKTEDYKIYGTDVKNGNNIKKINIPEKFAIIIGNEGNGINKNIKDLCDSNIYIKMNNRVESLNAAVAASIILYEVYNKNDVN